MQKTNLNLVPGSVLPVINVSQYDEGRQFQLALFDDASAYDLTGKTVTILVGKTDGNGCAYGAADLVNGVPVIAVSTNTITVTTPVQMTAAAGNNMAEIRIESSTIDIRTLNFILCCEPAALDPATPISDTQIPAIERAGWDAVDHYPYIDTNTNHWLVWDVATGQYVDTGVSAGGGGVTDYGDLTSKPQINGVQLIGNRSAAALGLATDAVMTGASSGSAGAKGLVPAPAAGDQGKFLRGDGTWQSEVDTLTGLTDTNISTPTDGQVLKYDSASSKWVNGNGGGGGASTLAGLSDVNLGTPTNGEPLTYDSTSSKWVDGGIIPTANGGTGNNDGYIRTGIVGGSTPGEHSTIEGYNNTATAYYEHVEGFSNTASGQSAHVEGAYNGASGYANHVEGANNTAGTNGYIHIEGSHNTANGANDHVEGSYNTVSGGGASVHVEGAHNTASSNYVHVGGYYNEAGYQYQTVIGKYNKNASDSLFEIGNGTADNLADRSNAIAVKNDGRIQKGASDAFAAASNLAPVEMTRTMASSHAAKSFLYVAADDQFYQVGSSALSVGATLTPGTNATAKSVADVLSALNSDLTSYSNIFGTDTTINRTGLYAERNAATNACYIGGYLYKALSAGVTAFTINFIATGNRPKRDIALGAFTSSANKDVSAYISTSGTLILKSNSGLTSSDTIFIGGSWLP